MGLPLRNVSIGTFTALGARSVHIPNYAGYDNRPNLAGASEITSGENGTSPKLAIETLESPGRGNLVCRHYVRVQRFVGTGSVITPYFA